MELDLTKMKLGQMPKYQPTPGRILIAFSIEQVATYRSFGSIEVFDSFHPDDYSIEEAIIYSTSLSQEKLKPGDSVLVDYSVFTAGRHQHARSNAEARLVYKGEHYWLYWCYDDQDKTNMSEILATVDEHGKVKAFNDLLLLQQTKGETESLIHIVTNLAGIFAQPNSKTEWMIVVDSPVPAVEEGQMVLVEKGYSPTIKYRGISMQYIRLPYVIGVLDAHMACSVLLF